MSTHFLKIENTWFERVKSGEKRGEIRKHDRDFQVGDEIVFVAPGEKTPRYVFDGKPAQELLAIRDDPDYSNVGDEFHCQTFRARITHVMARTEDTARYLPERFCLLSIDLVRSERLRGDPA